MLISSARWLVLLFTSVVLSWRLIDHFDEAFNGGFHMTRGGLALQGVNAEAVQLVIILGCLALIWTVTKTLERTNNQNKGIIRDRPRLFLRALLIKS